MILFCDLEGNIHDVNTTNDNSLIQIEITDDDNNPFKDWTTAKICAYRCQVIDGHVVSLTPRIDSRLIEHIDQLGAEAQVNAADAADLRAAVEELYELIESEV